MTGDGGTGKKMREIEERERERVRLCFLAALLFNFNYCGAVNPDGLQWTNQRSPRSRNSSPIMQKSFLSCVKATNADYTRGLTV